MKPVPPNRPAAIAGPSFPPFVKALASLLVLALLVWGIGVVQQWQGPLPSAGEAGFLAAVLAVVASGYWGILRSRTRIDGEAIEQSWLWRKRVPLAEITQVKLICVPGLAWLIVPRLVVRSGWGLTTFHAGDAALLSAFRRLALGR